MYKIRCTVSGGVTGFRTSFLKDMNGNIQTFASREEAEAEVERLRSMERISTATFRFEVESPFSAVEASS